MNTENLLHTSRPVYILIPRADQSGSAESKFWSTKLDGLHQNHLKASTKALRKARKRPAPSDFEDISLKVSNLHHGLAKALGAKSFDAWRDGEQSRVNFLLANGMTQPADLIKWTRHPFHLTARQLSDRLFNSGLPLPKKIFTGVGSKLFIAPDLGRIDLDGLCGHTAQNDKARLEWCEARANLNVLSLKRGSDWDANASDLIEFSGRDLLLHAFRFDHIAVALNLLGDNLVAPMQRSPEFRLYNASEDELAFDRRVFDIFREEIERSESGWVEVVPLPGNNNIIFLKGMNGRFDWVIRDQRDETFTGNPYHPILKSHELPTAMKISELKAHLYFKTGEWYEKLEHNAETRHYVEGGTASTWPGYPTLLMRELMATRRNYTQPSQQRGWGAEDFVPHRLNDYCLMVSQPVSIKEFWRFFEMSRWQHDRVARSEHVNSRLEVDLAAVNLQDNDHLPASVTWFDAVAFCHYYEEKTGLPVRLLEVEEWKQIAPRPAQDIKKDGWGGLTWAVVGGDDKTGGESKHRYPEACSEDSFLRFSKELAWTQNQEGLSFLSVVDFGEWLADYAHGYAPVANAATGRALMTGPLDRDRCPAHLTMRYKGLKVGFRLCYVAHPDA